MEILEVYEDLCSVYVVMEYLPHGTLLDYLLQDEKPLTKKDQKSIMRSLLSGLLYFHSRSLVHRDITLTNLLLTRDPLTNELGVKICDFTLISKVKSHFVNQRCGTPGYIAPEVFEGKRYEPICDVFSAGVIYYIL